MALALLAFFGLFAYTNYGRYIGCAEGKNGPIEMTEIKIETKPAIRIGMVPPEEVIPSFVKKVVAEEK